MTLFLTSSPSGCPFEPGPAIPVLDRRNHFLENLRAVWPDHPVRGLAIAADPHAYAQNDEMCRVFLQSFADAHLPLTELVPCDARNQEEIGTLLPRSGFVMLCGGHVPTQNHFFAQLGLPGLFHNYHGIVLGVSAGSMNAARLVYAAPEEPGEAADPGYCRWLNGLGLTETRILPHYQFIREHILDGQRMEDIALADSRKRHFLALPDGSYLMCSDGHEALYGKAWYFADGTLEEIKGFCAVATTEEIAQQDYILTPGRYVGIEEQEDDGEPFEEKMGRLTRELSELFAKRRKAGEKVTPCGNGIPCLW